MSTNEHLEQRIRERAFHLWIEDGQPFGKEAEHWERARTEIEGQMEPAENLIVTPPVNSSFGP